MPPAIATPIAPPRAANAVTAFCTSSGSVENAALNASTGVAPPESASANVCSAVLAVWNAGMSAVSAMEPISNIAFLAGMREVATSPIVWLKSACACLDAMRSPFRSWYACPASP